eukprot:GGOE01011630.1.p3 GENE.GGOE01011630.1~~GGOE01011630.1.p3  ORF type:complete len:187 (-),score=0.72 GGOE01011630.1:1172-1732(-)
MSACVSSTHMHVSTCAYLLSVGQTVLSEHHPPGFPSSLYVNLNILWHCNAMPIPPFCHLPLWHPRASQRHLCSEPPDHSLHTTPMPPTMCVCRSWHQPWPAILVTALEQWMRSMLVTRFMPAIVFVCCGCRHKSLLCNQALLGVARNTSRLITTAMPCDARVGSAGAAVPACAICTTCPFPSSGLT